MNIILKQLRHKAIPGAGSAETIIEGQIFIDGQYVCDTLQNEANTLPKGKYTIQVQKCNFRSRKMPLVIANPQNPQPPCSQCSKPESVSINTSPHKGGVGGGLLFCPQLAPGNGACNRHDGCILVGIRGARGLLLHPKNTFDQLYDRIRKNKQRGQEVTLTIQ